MRVLVAPQEFKGTLTAREAAEAMASGIRAARPDWVLDLAPIADGGPGTLDVLVAARGGEIRTEEVEDPLGRTVRARWAMLPGGVALVEMAEASGLWRLGPDERRAELTSTFGTGQLVRAALDGGCRALWLCAGGSATNDAGAGALEALGARLQGVRSRGGAALTAATAVDLTGMDPRLRSVRVRVLTDVRSPLLGPHGATFMFGPQKGADEAAVDALEAALAHFAPLLERASGRACAALPGAGAAGGLAFALACAAGAEIASGFEVVAEAIDLEPRILRAELVLTGEGRLDAQTGFGKGPSGVADTARRFSKRVICFAGSVGDPEAARAFDGVVTVSPQGAPPADAFRVLERAARAWASGFQ